MDKMQSVESHKLIINVFENILMFTILKQLSFTATLVTNCLDPVTSICKKNIPIRIVPD